MHGVQFGDDGRIQHKGVGKGVAERGVEFIGREGKQHPAVDGIKEELIQRGSTVRLKGGAVEGVHAEMEAAEVEPQPPGGVQGFLHVEIMGEGFGPVLPGVAAGIGTDETGGPIGRRAALMVTGEGLILVLAVIAKHSAALPQPDGIAGKKLPVIMGQLVPEVPRKGAVMLAHLLLDGGASGWIGFVEIQGDEAVHMAGEDRGATREGFQKIEPDSIRMGVTVSDWKAQAEELADGLPLGPLGARPAFAGAGSGEIGSGSCKGAGEALGGGIRGVDHPVALVGGAAAAAGLEGAAGERRL